MTSNSQLTDERRRLRIPTGVYREDTEWQKNATEHIEDVPRKLQQRQHIVYFTTQEEILVKLKTLEITAGCKKNTMTVVQFCTRCTKKPAVCLPSSVQLGQVLTFKDFFTNQTYA